MENDFLNRIASHLIVNTSFTGDLGLYHGKMGILLFFAHCAEYMQKDIYNDFASKILEEIYAEIHSDTPINLKNGLCGIGWGIEYLLQMNFMEGDSNEILSDIDKKIMERDPLRMSDGSFETGVEGILYYVIVRLTSPKRAKEDIPFDASYLKLWEKLILQNKNYPNSGLLNSLFLQWINGEKVYMDMNKYIVNLISDNERFDDEFIYLPFGLQKGCAGIGLKNIL